MSERSRIVASAVQGSAAAEEAARAAKVRRSAWMLAVLAALFYVGFIAWNVMRGTLGI